MNSKTGLFARLGKTREALSRGLAGIFSSSRSFEDSDFEDLEDQLIMADMGVELSQPLVAQLRKRVSREKPEDAAGLVECLREEILEVLQGVTEPDSVDTPSRPGADRVDDPAQGRRRAEGHGLDLGGLQRGGVQGPGAAAARPPPTRPAPEGGRQ